MVLRSRGRRRASQEYFARIPESAMTSEALKTLPHAAFRVLAILVMGHAEERNGTMMCTDSYAKGFGITSRETVYRSLHALEERGVIVRTRQGMRMRRMPTLWAVTWWPIYFQEGQPLAYPQAPTHAYLEWTCTPIVGVKEEPEEIQRTSNKLVMAEVHTGCRGSVTPMAGVQHSQVHTDLSPESSSLHTDSREYSKSLAGAPAESGR